MKKRMIVYGFIALAALLILACTPKIPETTAEAPPVPTPDLEVPAVNEEEVEEIITEEDRTASGEVIEITSAGFSPKTITINAGETVTFINKDTAAHWPASNVHPTHSTYPGSSIEKCGTAEESSIFDACKALAEGEEYSFTFTRTGRWPFHDHRNPSKSGTVVVE